MSDVKIILAGATLVVSILKIVTQYRIQIDKENRRKKDGKRN